METIEMGMEKAVAKRKGRILAAKKNVLPLMNILGDMEVKIVSRHGKIVALGKAIMAKIATGRRGSRESTAVGRM